MTSNTFSKTYNIYSPRWNHETPIIIYISSNRLEIKVNHTLTCTVNQQGEYIWDTDGVKTLDNYLEDALKNDEIEPPTDIKDIIEKIWDNWKKGYLNDNDLEAEMKKLWDWVDIISKNKPEFNIQ